MTDAPEALEIDEAEPETCCPGREDCTRTQPPKLFQVDGDGCWAVAMVYETNEDGTLAVSAYHLLAEPECHFITRAMQITQAAAAP